MDTSNMRYIFDKYYERMNWNGYFDLMEIALFKKKFYDITYCVLSMDSWTNPPLAVPKCLRVKFFKYDKQLVGIESSK